jgi:uncharacterized protein (TIGR00269 family)
MPKCRICGGEATVYLPHSRLWLCDKHFNEFIEKRVLETINRYGLIRRGSRILLGVSGGKDSDVLAHILSKLSNVIGFNLYLLHIDLGIGFYSEVSRRLVSDLALKLNIPLIIIDLRKLLGMGIPELSRKTHRPPCSVCGIVKRYLLNAVAVELGVDAVATGHNMDDMAVFILKEFLSQNIENLSKLTPRIDGVKGFLATRIKPLYEVYERDIMIYAEKNNIVYVKDKCPYSVEKSLTNTLKQLLSKTEENHPGLIIGFIRRFMKNIEKYPRPRETYKRCSICGMPSSGDTCSFCRLTKKALGKPMGLKTREHIRSVLEEMNLIH